MDPGAPVDVRRILIGQQEDTPIARHLCLPFPISQLSSPTSKKAIPVPCAGRHTVGHYNRCAVSAGVRHRFCCHIVKIPIRPLQMCEVERVSRILILEDYAPLCRVLAVTLQRAGCEVALARSAFEALQVLEQHTYDTLLVDMDMANGE